MNKVDHSQTPPVEDGKTLQEHRTDILERNAKDEAEALFVSDASGRMDHSFNERLRKCFANDAETGALNWRATLALRQKLVKEYEWRRELGV